MISTLLYRPQIAWPLIANFCCPLSVTPGECPRSENRGWRYFLFTMGGLMLFLWAIRFFVFKLYESPKYLMGRGRDKEAVEVVRKVAEYNGTTSSLTVEQLIAAGDYATSDKHDGPGMDTSARAAIARKLKTMSGDHVRALFATRKLAWSTSLLITLWGTCLLLCDHRGFP
jgi:hypothetical protein